MFFCKFVLWLMLYSFIGWIYEIMLCSYEEKRFVNRGFLYGPYCPIYGFGAILDIIILSSINSYLLLFLFGAILTCSLEYFVSWLLENLFNARWWDYRYMKYNIKGRICLLGALVFGIFSVLLIKMIHPFFLKVFDKIPSVYLIILSLILLIILTVDLFFTLINLSQFNQKIKEFQNYIGEVKDFMSRLTQYDKRLIKSFPKFHSINYNDAVKKIREHLKKKQK